MVAMVLAGACISNDPDPIDEPSGDTDTDSDTDTDTDTDTDADSDTDADTDSDVDPFDMDCSDCPAVGDSLDNMRCAIDLCDDTYVLLNEYTSPNGATTDGTKNAVDHFGEALNDLEPMANGSYTLMASGLCDTTEHTDFPETTLGGDAGVDSFSSDEQAIYDVFEWKLRLKAPDTAGGFRIHYVFFSVEYDEFISSEANDKFYIFIESAGTNGGERSVINFTECRDPDAYHDFVCDAETMDYCEDGEKYCYVAINTALSECCWYPHNSQWLEAPDYLADPCPEGTAETDISGTGFECAPFASLDSHQRGSSTGWLKTEWSVAPGEEFNLIFHIHDTNDRKYDSEIILDKFEFLENVDEGGTGPV